jgi:hypothetical protein
MSTISEKLKLFAETYAATNLPQSIIIDGVENVGIPEMLLEAAALLDEPAEPANRKPGRPPKAPVADENRS